MFEQNELLRSKETIIEQPLKTILAVGKRNKVEKQTKNYEVDLSPESRIITFEDLNSSMDSMIKGSDKIILKIGKIIESAQIDHKGITNGLIAAIKAAFKAEIERRRTSASANGTNMEEVRAYFARLA